MPALAARVQDRSSRLPRMNGQAYRAIVAGLGRMGTYHLRVLNLLPGVEVVAVVDPSDERRAAAAQLHGPTASFAELGDALDSVEADFACLAVPVEQLPALGRSALEAGLAVFLEKPMAPSEEAAIELIRLADARGLLLSVGHVERFNPAVMLLKQKLDDGEAGQIFQIHARRLSPFPDRDSMLGVSLDLATHDLDIIRYLTGSEVSRVYAEVAQRAHAVAEDLICASLRMDDGSTGLLEVNWMTPAKVRELSVTSERGMFVVNYLTQDLFFYENPLATIQWDALNVVRGTGEGNMVRYALERREPLRVEWEAFISALGDPTAAAVTGWDGVAAMSTARAIRQSGESHEAVVPRYRELFVQD
jgi:UDP-N-acetylglucosamine 3-dehydrogenase